MADTVPSQKINLSSWDTSIFTQLFDCPICNTLRTVQYYAVWKVSFRFSMPRARVPYRDYAKYNNNNNNNNKQYYAKFVKQNLVLGQISLGVLRFCPAIHYSKIFIYHSLWAASTVLWVPIPGWVLTSDLSLHLAQSNKVIVVYFMGETIKLSLKHFR
jgi:hypothetical protein